MATWAEFGRAAPALEAFGRERFEDEVMFHATLRLDGAPRLHPVSPWFAVGFLAVGFREGSPKIAEVRRDGRNAMFPGGQPRGRGRRVHGPRVDGATRRRRTVALARPYDASYGIAAYACSVEEVFGTTYEGDATIRHRWPEP